MVFSDTTNKNGIIQQIEAGINIGDTGISGDATLLKQYTAIINNYYSKATHIIITSDGVWKWDDSNHTNLASATADLVADQSDYSVLASAPDTDKDWLEVMGVNVKDSSGQWYKLAYKANKNFGRTRLERTTVSGQPSTYFFEGTQVFLDAQPNYASTGGIEILFNRAPLFFSSSDTTKRPGFSTLYHEYLVLGGIYWWQKNKAVGDSEKTKRDLAEMERAMAEFYNNRNEYEPTTVKRPPYMGYRAYK